MKILREQGRRSLISLCFLLVCIPSLYAEGGGRLVKEPSAYPGINDVYLSPRLDVERFKGMFESEWREIYALRHPIVRSLGLKTGMTVADIGAGTGFFSVLFARDVGPQGKVFANEIAPNFLRHLNKLKEHHSLDQIEVVEGTETSAELPHDSIDLAFVSDTYHHFEYPRAMLVSLYSALKTGGTLVIVDFQRIPGLSSPWVMRHVRAGKRQVIAEIESAGFSLDQELHVPRLRENYMIRFRKPFRH